MTPTDMNAVKLLLQRHFGDGLVVVIGSGLSCAEGLPSMSELGDHLILVVGKVLPPEDQGAWGRISNLVKKKGLESALLTDPPPPAVEAAIAKATSELILAAEEKVISEVFRGIRTLRFTRLIPHLLKPPTGLPIVTPNYDRLIEIACEEAGLGVDTMFVGQFAGELNEVESKLSFLREVKLQGDRVRRRFRDRAVVFKPHGSLDWYHRVGKPVRYSGTLDATRLIITPGLNKFRNGYESPFDRHREKANRAIDNASRFLVIGYGFNDDHLQTHLTPMISSGKPTLLMSRNLSPVALELARRCPNVIAIDAAPNNGSSATRVFIACSEVTIGGPALWDLQHFVSEVFEP
jgi:SIR2-like protein